MRRPRRKRLARLAAPVQIALSSDFGVGDIRPFLMLQPKSTHVLRPTFPRSMSTLHHSRRRVAGLEPLDDVDHPPPASPDGCDEIFRVVSAMKLVRRAVESPDEAIRIDEKEPLTMEPPLGLLRQRNQPLGFLIESSLGRTPEVHRLLLLDLAKTISQPIDGPCRLASHLLRLREFLTQLREHRRMVLIGLLRQRATSIPLFDRLCQLLELTPQAQTKLTVRPRDEVEPAMARHVAAPALAAHFDSKPLEQLKPVGPQRVAGGDRLTHGAEWRVRRQDLIPHRLTRRVVMHVEEVQNVDDALTEPGRGAIDRDSRITMADDGRISVEVRHVGLSIVQEECKRRRESRPQPSVTTVSKRRSPRVAGHRRRRAPSNGARGLTP